PGGAALRDLVDAEECRLVAGRNHLREQRSRERLRAAEHDRQHGSHHPRLRDGVEKTIGVDDEPHPNAKRQDDRVFVPMRAAIRSKHSAPANATNCTISTSPIRNDSSAGTPRETNSSCARNTDAIEITV